MSARFGLVVFGFGVLALSVGLFLPALIDAPTNQARTAESLEEGQMAKIDGIRLELVEVNQGQGFVNLTVTDLATLESANISNLSVGETKTATPVDDPVEVSLTEITGGTEATLEASFPWTYGWNDSAKLIVDNFDVLLVLVGFVTVLGGIAAIINQ